MYETILCVYVCVVVEGIGICKTRNLTMILCVNVSVVVKSM